MRGIELLRRGGSWSGLAVEALDGIHELLLNGGEFGLDGLGEFSASEGGATEDGRDAQGAGDLGNGHFAEVLVTEGFEEARGGGVEFLGSIPFLFAEAAEAAGPIGGLLALEGGEVAGVLVNKAGVKGLKAIGPIVFGGPFLDGVKGFSELIGDRLMGGGVAEPDVSDEGGEGARGFAGQRLE